MIISNYRLLVYDGRISVNLEKNLYFQVINPFINQTMPMVVIQGTKKQEQTMQPMTLTAINI